MLRILSSTYLIVAELVGAESSTIDKGILLDWASRARGGGRLVSESARGSGAGRSCDAPFGVSLAVAVFSPVSAPLGGPLLRPNPFTAVIPSATVSAARGAPRGPAARPWLSAPAAG